MSSELIEHAKRVATCVHLATDAGPAEDIANTIKQLIGEIARLEGENKRMRDVLLKSVEWGKQFGIEVEGLEAALQLHGTFDEEVRREQ